MGPDGVDEPAHKGANLTPARPLAGRSRTLTKRRSPSNTTSAGSSNRHGRHSCGIEYDEIFDQYDKNLLVVRVGTFWCCASLVEPNVHSRLGYHSLCRHVELSFKGGMVWYRKWNLQPTISFSLCFDYGGS